MDVGTQKKKRIIFDPIYGFIQISQVEFEIIHSSFYQRLRWIRQLGFSSYVFHGAEHSRFGHSIGVMFNAHKILQSTGKGVEDNDLFEKHPNASSEIKFHQCLRLGALMHDLGTFPFSHTTEAAYIKFGETAGVKGRKDDHEHLGSYIIKNTDYEGGITHILKKYDLDPQEISDLVKGVSPSILSNQILHSELDCDRMDYLLRDAHYTGLKYGAYDREYLLHHFQVDKVGNHEILTIKHNALHCVEDFLNSRFAWYSQVVRSARGAKYDAVAEKICYYLLEKGLMWRYSDLLEKIAKEPFDFYSFNDHYFIRVLHENHAKGVFDKDVDIKEMVECLLFEKSPRTLRLDEFKQRLLNQNNPKEIERIYKHTTEKVNQISELLEKKGSKSDWLIPDIPSKNVMFIKSHGNIVKSTSSPNILLERDPVKIKYEYSGEIKLLSDVENSTLAHLQSYVNFIPNVYCSESAYKLLESNGII